jgi:YgiT-type zinc finger domain-containing protein
MICLICRLAETTDAFTEITLQRGEAHLVITQVPAHVCLRCGESFVDQVVASQLLERADEKVKAGMRDARYAFNVV